jgi:hypothetical protein
MLIVAMFRMVSDQIPLVIPQRQEATAFTRCRVDARLSD